MSLLPQFYISFSLQMALHLFPNFCLIFFTIIIFILVSVPTSVSANEKFLNCSTPFYCANIGEISYPFWGSSRADYCGYPGYELQCEGEAPEITVGERTYRVLDINNNSRTLTVARQDYWADICPSIHANTTLNFSLFSYSSDIVNVTLYYDCPSLPSEISPLLLPFGFSCSSDGADGNNYYFPGRNNFNDTVLPAIWDFLRSCDYNVIIPVLQSTLVSMANYPALVNLTEALDGGFRLQWYANNSLCDHCTQSNGLCGYNTSTLEFTCYCYDQSYPDRCPPEKSKSGTGAVIGIAVGCAGFVFLLFCAFILVLRRRNAAKTKSKDLLALPSSTTATSSTLSFSQSIPSYPFLKSDLTRGSNYFGAQVFSYNELEEATNNFDSSKELGDGGFGTVYYGLLKDGREVAVKRLYEKNFKRVEQFKNEIEILNRLRHPNLVALYGCTSRHCRELILVYEYIPNGTVADHIHGGQSNSRLLTWPIRLNIAVETADALTYLHANDVIHRDVKTNNILLDNNFNVKVADFGLSRLFPNNVTHVSTAPQGTPGYVDPEYYQCYQLTEKSDVYSFGVVLIELISSLQAVDTNRHRHDINLANMALSRIQNHALNELIDPSLGFETDYAVRNMVTSVAELAFRCLQQDREMRPAMLEVLEVLKEIQNQHFGALKAEVVDICTTDDVVLLKNIPPPVSPDSAGTDKWVSSSTPSSSF